MIREDFSLKVFVNVLALDLMLIKKYLKRLKMREDSILVLILRKSKISYAIKSATPELAYTTNAVRAIISVNIQIEPCY